MSWQEPYKRRSLFLEYFASFFYLVGHLKEFFFELWGYMMMQLLTHLFMPRTKFLFGLPLIGWEQYGTDTSWDCSFAFFSFVITDDNLATH
jgi:hypothetical protein